MRIMFFATLFSLLAAPLYSHQCVLSGTDASDITIYNACKNDLVMGMDGHDKSATSGTNTADDTSQRLILLEAENRQLQAKLGLLRNRLLDLMKDL